MILLLLKPQPPFLIQNTKWRAVRISLQKRIKGTDLFDYSPSFIDKEGLQKHFEHRLPVLLTILLFITNSLVVLD